MNTQDSPIEEDRSSATRERILHAACAVIAEVGFERVRMRMVAGRAGVSTALLHYHFVNRETLFQDALRYSFRAFGRITPEDGRPAFDALTDVIRTNLPSDGELRQDWHLWLELWARGQRDTHVRALAAEMYAESAAEAEEIICHGIGTGEFREVDPAATATAILALCDGLGVRVMLGVLASSDAVAAAVSFATVQLGTGGQNPSRSRR